MEIKTSRDQPKSASYLRLKNSKRTSKYQSILFYSTQKIPSWTELGPFGEFFEVSQCRKKLKGDPLVSPGIVCYAEKNEKSFWFSSLGDTLKFCRTFGRTILVTSGVSKKTLTKSHDYCRLFSRKAPTKNRTRMVLIFNFVRLHLGFAEDNQWRYFQWIGFN